MPDEPLFNFHSEHDTFTLKDEQLISNWLQSIVTKEQKEVSQINYVFVSDEALLKLNKEYLDHHDFTDILSFQLEENPIEGDIFISIDRVRENAESYKVSFDNELLRVIAHGLLHFIGYKDKTDQEKMEMRKKEEECLLMISTSLNHRDS